MGFFVPAVWKNFRSFKTMFFMGLAVSLGIELLQIFTFRLTDIDDLITNTAGTVLGYEISRRFSFPFSLKSVDSKGILVRYEPVLILAVMLLISIFLKPMGILLRVDVDVFQVVPVARKERERCRHHLQQYVADRLEHDLAVGEFR